MDDDMIKPGQIQSLKSGIRSILGNVDTDVCCYMARRLLYLKELESLSDITRQQWKTLRKTLYPRYHDDDWTVGDDTRVAIADLYEEYREEILGQMKLF